MLTLRWGLVTFECVSVMGVMLLLMTIKKKTIIALEDKREKERTYEFILWIRHYGQHTRCVVSIMHCQSRQRIQNSPDLCCGVTGVTSSVSCTPISPFVTHGFRSMQDKHSEMTIALNTFRIYFTHCPKEK